MASVRPVVAVVSGKGGVRKSSMTAALVCAFAQGVTVGALAFIVRAAWGRGAES